MDLDPFPAFNLLCMIPADIAVFSVSQIVALSVALVCLFLSGFVSGSEISFFSLSPAHDDEIEESPKRDAILSLLSSPKRLLATILIANNMVNVTIVVLCSFALNPVFSSMKPWLSFLLQTVILTFLILLFGEILPKLIANNYPRTVGPVGRGGGQSHGQNTLPVLVGVGSQLEICESCR